MSDQESSQSKSIDVQSLALVALEQFNEIAWVKLGLHPDPLSGTLEMNLSDARFAIDLASSMSQVIEKDLDDEDRRRLQSMLRDLKLNYVSKSREESP